jgi:membrane protease subunit (stomatin/prohibitin family)
MRPPKASDNIGSLGERKTMALYDVVQFEGTGSDWLLYKCPRNDYNTRLSLIVGPGQIAICVHNGKIEKILEEGKYVLNTDLLPFVKTLVEGVHGGKNAYPMEVYFINKRLKLDTYWGTSDPIKLVDPEYHVQINVRARGQMGIRLKDYQYFLQTLVGTLMKDSWINFDIIQNYFRGLINQKAKKIIASYMLDNKISIFNIEAKLEDIANLISGELTPEMAKYGFEVSSFSVESINVPQEDTDALNAIFHKRAEFEQLGDNRYRTARGYDVLEGAANNEGGAAGSAASIGVGLAAGMSMGNTMSKGATGTEGIIPPAEAPKEETTVECPSCHAKVAKGAKFCPNCGHAMSAHCPNCGVEVDPSAKFCPSCGKPLK